MNDQIEADQAFFNHLCDELSRLWQSLTPPTLRYDDPTFLAQLRDNIDLLINQLEHHFRGRYALNGSSYASADRAFRAFFDQLYQAREAIDSLQLQPSIAHQQVISI